VILQSRWLTKYRRSSSSLVVDQPILKTSNRLVSSLTTAYSQKL
jgi:hypothetical protein